MVVPDRPSPWRVMSLALLDLVYPIACVGCGSTGTSPSPATQWLCPSCRQRIVSDRASCLVCGRNAPSGRTCHPCREATPLTGTLAIGPYRDPVLHGAVKGLKFHGVRALADPLGELLARRIAAAGVVKQNQTLLVPLPLHRRRERQRGFNQARLLADAVGNRLALPVADLLERSRSTAPQTSIYGTGRLRATNVHDAFRFRENLFPASGTRFILVDDVLTTGASLTAAARVLTTLAPEEIWAAVVARG